MKRMIRKIVEKTIQTLAYSANQRVARELLALTDKQLEDIGFSREKLHQGAAGYPWVSEVDTSPALRFVEHTSAKIVGVTPAANCNGNDHIVAA